MYLKEQGIFIYQLKYLRNPKQEFYIHQKWIQIIFISCIPNFFL